MPLEEQEIIDGKNLQWDNSRLRAAYDINNKLHMHRFRVWCTLWIKYFLYFLFPEASHVSLSLTSLSLSLFFCRYFAEHDKATALQMLHDSLQPKHKYDFHISLIFLVKAQIKLKEYTKCFHTKTPWLISVLSGDQWLKFSRIQTWENVNFKQMKSYFNLSQSRKNESKLILMCLFTHKFMI